MSNNATQNTTSREADLPTAAAPRFGRAKRAARGAVVAGTIAALSLTAIPTAARAGGPGVGAAIGLGIVGGVLAGAAIAATAPVYAAPSPYYYGPNGYYGTAPAYYYAPPQPYYGSAPAAYPQANYGYSYAH
jgi:hypothetical protein